VRVRRSLRKDSNKANFIFASAAIAGAEALRRSFPDEGERNIRIEERFASLTKFMPSLLHRIPSLAERADCESKSQWIPEHFSRIRRYETFAKLQDTAITEDTLESKYAVQWRKPLGQGTFGSVYLAKDRKTGERCAVKKIPKEFTDNLSFKREMDALLRLRDEGGHPHICGLRENYEEGEYYYLILDLISGGEMFDHLCAQGAYSEADAARLIREVASALAFMHGIGIVHGE